MHYCWWKLLRLCDALCPRHSGGSFAFTTTPPFPWLCRLLRHVMELGLVGGVRRQSEVFLGRRFRRPRVEPLPIAIFSHLAPSYRLGPPVLLCPLFPRRTPPLEMVPLSRYAGPWVVFQRVRRTFGLRLRLHGGPLARGTSAGQSLATVAGRGARRRRRLAARAAAEEERRQEKCQGQQAQ